MKTDKEFLLWLAARLVHVYKESELVDFVQRLQAIAQKQEGTTSL